MSCSEFSLKESSGLLSIVQLSKFFVLSFATALIDYHIFRRLSTTFLFLLFQRCVLARNSLSRISCSSTFVNNFFHFIYSGFSVVPHGQRCFSALSHATACIIQHSGSGIVNIVFNIYLIQTIQSILPPQQCYSYAHLQLLYTLRADHLSMIRSVFLQIIHLFTGKYQHCPLNVFFHCIHCFQTQC